jgi:hypothetical protein
MLAAGLRFEVVLFKAGAQGLTACLRLCLHSDQNLDIGFRFFCLLGVGQSSSGRPAAKPRIFLGITTFYLVKQLPWQLQSSRFRQNLQLLHRTNFVISLKS